MSKNNNYILWTLNAAQKLVNQEVLDNNFTKGFFITGDRSKSNIKFDKKTKKQMETEELHNLMPEPEYFVPIAAKCIGQRLSDNYLSKLDNETKAKVKNIRKYFYNIWSNDPKRSKYKENNIYQSFWKEGAGPDDSSGMKTKNHAGYYDILKESFEKTGKMNILVGYSQGGLVARYLAWLDEKVFNEGIIDGIITVQSANYGSPLANCENAQGIIDLLMTSFLSMISMYEKYFPLLNKYVTENIDFENLKTILEDIRIDAKKELDKGNENAQWIYDFIITAQKWTSGLDNCAYDTAFCDLNMGKILKKGEENSILASVNDTEGIITRIKYGAIVSAMNDFVEIMKSIISEMKKGKCIMKIIFSNMLKKKFIMGNTFQENFDNVTNLYKKIMLEKNIKNKITQIYKDGHNKNDPGYTVDRNLPALSHDFVIPSSYQLLQNNKENNYLGILLNKKANHNSGKSREFEAGRINSKLIVKLLKNFLK